MIRATIDINGTQHATIEIVNRGAPQDEPEAADDPTGVRVYRWTLLRQVEGNLTPLPVATSTVRHARGNGWAALIENVLQDVQANLDTTFAPPVRTRHP